MNLEKALAKIKILEEKATSKEAELLEATNKINKLTLEGAEGRVLNKHQKKNLYVAKSIIRKNNIKVDYDKISTDGLTLDPETGEVKGEVAYNPESEPGPGAGIPPSGDGAPPALTIEGIQSMSRQDIAKNWDAVSSVLTAQG